MLGCVHVYARSPQVSCVLARTPADVVGLGQFIRVLHDIHETSIAGGEGDRKTARHF